MSRSAVLTSIRRLRSLLAVQQDCEQSDEQLLAVFAECRDEIAFATLVRRYGPMVLGVCRRVLGHVQDAEDAYQATFLVLARRVAVLHDKTALASFLYGTAFHLASKIKRAAGRRRKYEGSLGALTQSRSPADPADELLWREVRELLDEEIARLPEKYRSVFVLCCLENLSRAEAGQRLGLKERTVLSRLAEARKRLSQRLTRRGVELTAVLAATAVIVSSASALPAGLMAGTVKAALALVAGEELAGMVSAAVAELVQSMTAATIVSKAKLATGVLLAMSLLTVATSGALVSWYGRANEPPAAEDDGKPKAASPKRDTAKTTEIQGRVVDPDDKPVKDARLYWPRIRKDSPRADDFLEMVERGHTDGEGRFRFALPSSEDRHDSLRTLVARAPGYGLSWVDVPKAKLSGSITVRLRNDVTIRGRILSMEGKPLAGVRVRIDRLEEMTKGGLGDYLAFWERDWTKASALKPRQLLIPSKQSILSPVVTDQNGCFRLSGVGSEHIIRLRLRGEGMAHAILSVIARPAFDPSALNKSARNRAATMAPYPGLPPVLYGPSFEYVASPERIVEGVVREAGSGKPVPGVRIYGSAGYRSDSEAITDKEGRYFLRGLPKVKQYHLLQAEPPWESSWLPISIQNKEAREGLQPVQVDFALARGVIIKGRVIDRTTGKGVPSSIMFDYLPGNKYAAKPGYDLVRGSYATDDDSEDDARFRIKVAPGAGVLKAHASGAINPFKPAQFSADDRKHVTLTEDGDFTTLDGGIGFLTMYNTVKWMDLAPDAGIVHQDLYVEPGATAKVRIQDLQGKPLSGVIVSGIDAIPGQHSQKAYVAPAAECTIVALDPHQPRQVIFYHAERRLAGALTVRGDEKKPLTVRLAATGTVIGCVRDADGQPIRGADVEIWAKGPPSSTSLVYLYLALNQNRLPVRTDREGRFRLESVVPDCPFDIDVRHRGAYLDLGSRTKQLRVKAGQTLDLGDIRVKPAD